MPTSSAKPKIGGSTRSHRARQAKGTRGGRAAGCGAGLGAASLRTARAGAASSGVWKTAETMSPPSGRRGGLDLEAVGVLHRILAVPDHAVDHLAAAQRFL